MSLAGEQKQKSFNFLKKKTKTYAYCQLVTQQVLLNRYSFNHQCISKIKVKEFVFIPLFLCIFICIICTHYVCLYFIDLYLFSNTLPILDTESIGALFGAYFFGKKGHFACSHSRNRCHF